MTELHRGGPGGQFDESVVGSSKSKEEHSPRTDRDISIVQR